MGKIYDALKRAEKEAHRKREKGHLLSHRSTNLIEGFSALKDDSNISSDNRLSAQNKNIHATTSMKKSILMPSFLPEQETSAKKGAKGANNLKKPSQISNPT